MKRVPWPRPPVGRAISPRTAFWCACCTWVLTLGVTATALVYTAVHPLPARLVNQQGSGADGVAGIAFVTGFATVGALLVWKRPGQPHRMATVRDRPVRTRSASARCCSRIFLAR